MLNKYELGKYVSQLLIPSQDSSTNVYHINQNIRIVCAKILGRNVKIKPDALVSILSEAGYQITRNERYIPFVSNVISIGRDETAKVFAKIGVEKIKSVFDSYADTPPIRYSRNAAGTRIYERFGDKHKPKKEDNWREGTDDFSDVFIQVTKDNSLEDSIASSILQIQRLREKFRKDNQVTAKQVEPL